MTQSFPFGADEAALLESAPAEQLRILIDYLGTTSKRRVALATHVLNGGGPEIIPLLIREAFSRERRPSHAVRLLDIVARIGGPISFDDRMLLSVGRHVGHKALRAKCVELLMQVSYASHPFRSIDAASSI
jgi:hypothetical protein